jgi:hypothetical protein
MARRGMDLPVQRSKGRKEEAAPVDLSEATFIESPTFEFEKPRRHERRVFLN